MTKVCVMDADNQQKLKRYMGWIRALYDVEAFLAQPVNRQTITTYYNESKHFYTLFHSPRGAVHIGVSANGTFTRRDYEVQPAYISSLIDGSSGPILELGSGKGFNICYLATRHPQRQFVGVDLTPVHVSIAQAKARRLKLDNTRFQVGDFHNLGDFADAEFDDVFAVESVCHALDKRQVLESAYRVLKPGGRLILIDTYRKRSANLTTDEYLATRLIEQALAVAHSIQLDDMLETAEQVGFMEVERSDIAPLLLPNLVRHEKLASLFFRVPVLRNLWKMIIPRMLPQTAIAGLLLPIAYEENLLGYMRLVLQKT